MKRKSKNYTPKEKVIFLKRHLVDKVPVSDLCDEYGVPAAAQASRALAIDVSHMVGLSLVSSLLCRSHPHSRSWGLMGLPKVVVPRLGYE